MKFGKDYYDFSKNIQHFDMAIKGEWQKIYVEYLKRVLDLKGSVLDFGCALGSITSAMVDIGIDASGLEIDQWYVDNCPFENLKPSRIKSYNGLQIPFNDESFNFIHSSQTFEHVDRKVLPLIFEECYRILKPNGVLYFSTPGEKGSDEGDDPTHISCLKMTEWHDLIVNHGFSNMTEEYAKKWASEKMFKAHGWIQHVGAKQ